MHTFSLARVLRMESSTTLKVSLRRVWHLRIPPKKKLKRTPKTNLQFFLLIRIAVNTYRDWLFRGLPTWGRAKQFWCDHRQGFYSISLGIGAQPTKAFKIPSIIKNPGSKKMAGTGDIMIQLFSCCIQQQPSPTRRRHQRLRIDRSMIGNPTNFVHTGLSLLNHELLKIFINAIITGHIGSNDAELSSQHLTVIQSQMQSKGGYDINSLRVQVCHHAS